MIWGMSSSFFSFHVKEDSGDNAEYITFESIVKVEPGDSIEDTTLEPIVKLDPDDEGEAQIWNFREKGEHCFLKREVKEENEVHDDNGDEDDIEEEIKPPARVFLESEESWNGVINQELEDPLAMCNESFNGKNSSFVDGEYSTSGELHTQVGSTWEKSNGACNKGNGLTPHNAEGKLKKTAASDKESVNDTRLSNPDNSRQKGKKLKEISTKLAPRPFRNKKTQYFCMKYPYLKEL